MNLILTLWDSGVGEEAEEFGRVPGGEEVRVFEGVFEVFLTMLLVREYESSQEQLSLDRLSA